MHRALLLYLVAIVCLRAADNVILITADGLRWQDLFTGIDPKLMNEKTAGMAEGEELRKRFWNADSEIRRKTLLPFFWSTFAPSGVVFGNVEKNSSVRVTNSYRVSYPGYSEILTGRSQDEVIRGNDKIQNPTQTVLEFIRERLKLPSDKVAVFGTWDVFPYIAENKPGTIYINAGLDERGLRPDLLAVQRQIQTPWNGERFDYITLSAALDYMRAHKPRVMFISLGETDDWAHDRRYDRVLTSIQFFDNALRQVHEFVQKTPEYRGRTAIVVTSDHGRGANLEDWHGHGSKVAGADQIWVAMSGPGIAPVGEAHDVPEHFQRDLAPTILKLLGIDPEEYKGATGSPLPVSAR